MTGGLERQISCRSNKQGDRKIETLLGFMINPLRLVEEGVKGQ